MQGPPGCAVSISPYESVTSRGYHSSTCKIRPSASKGSIYHQILLSGRGTRTYSLSKAVREIKSDEGTDWCFMGTSCPPNLLFRICQSPTHSYSPATLCTLSVVRSYCRYDGICEAAAAGAAAAAAAGASVRARAATTATHSTHMSLPSELPAVMHGRPVSVSLSVQNPASTAFICQAVMVTYRSDTRRGGKSDLTKK